MRAIQNTKREPMFGYMYKAFTFAVLAGLFLHSPRTSAQVAPPPDDTFDCDTISPSPSGKSKTYDDLGRGFRFEFPREWEGQQSGVASIGVGTISVTALLAAVNPNLYVGWRGSVT